MGPSGNMWVTTIFPFPFKQAVNGTFANQSAYTQEIHLKVSYSCMNIVHCIGQQSEWSWQENGARLTNCNTITVRDGESTELKTKDYANGPVYDTYPDSQLYPLNKP